MPLPLGLYVGMPSPAMAGGLLFVPMGGEFTGVVGIPEPGSKGLRDGETLPTEYADTVGGVAAAAALCCPGLGPAATALGDDGWLALGPVCFQWIAGAGAGAIAGAPGAIVTVELLLPAGLGVVVTVAAGGGGTAGPATAGAVLAFVPVMAGPAKLFCCVGFGLGGVAETPFGLADVKEPGGAGTD